METFWTELLLINGIHWTLCRKLKFLTKAQWAHYINRALLIIVMWMCLSPSSCLLSRSFISSLPLWFPVYLWSGGPFLPATPPPVVCLASSLLRSPCQSPPGPIRAQPHLVDQQIKRKQKCVCVFVCVCWIWANACVHEATSVCLFAWICRLVLCVYLRMCWCRLGASAE